MQEWWKGSQSIISTNHWLLLHFFLIIPIYFTSELIQRSHIFTRRDWFPLLITWITWCHRPFTMPGTGPVNSSFHICNFLSWWQLCCFLLDKIMECGNGKNKSSANFPTQTYLFFSFRVQKSVLDIFSHNMLPFYILIVPQRDFLLLFSEKQNKTKHSEGSSRSGNSFIVSYTWPIFDISAFFLDMFSLFIF